MARRLRGSRCRGERGSAPPTGPTRALALLVLLWLYAAGGSTAPVYNLSLAVDEGLPAETLVGDIRAGLPAGAESPGGFLLSEGSGESAVLADFHVQPETGIIRTARRLDRERRARYSFAAATLRGEVVQVEIAVTDVNDHPPRFPGDSLQLNVSELSPPGTAFRLPAARDPDAGRFGTQGYALLEEGGAAGEPPLFQLRYGRPEPLELVLLRRLDRERAEVHRLVVEAWDGGSPRRRGRLRVSVRVLDENDNAPTFSRGEYRARLREDAAPGTAVCRLRATDPDLGANGEVRYAINRRQSDPDGYFTVEERSGVLRLRRPLDREARALHRLVVEARDGGAQPEVSSVLVSVAVLDVNDNRPAIRLLYLTESGGPRVSEGARPGDYVARVSVSDADEDGEAEGGGGIALALLGGDGAFALRAAGAGVFFLCVAGPLDRESRDLYELRLVATDGGTPPLSAEEPLLLRVADLNDEAPAFPQPHYRATVSEAASPGTAVLRLSASDADEPGSPNAEVRYALEGDPAALALLRIDARSGAVSTRARLDRERQAALELRVVARDGGVPARAAACRLSVRVEDANDNEPRFERPVYRARLPEHAAPGRRLVQVKATDADADQFGEIEYSLYDGFHFYEKSKAFQIDPRTGQICVSQDIDREEDPTTYDLLVKATDGGGLSAQAFVRIEIEDINDNQPIFEQDIYVTSISSHTQPGTEVINVVATDRDSGIYGLVTYELVPGEFSSFFTVDTSTGTIYLVSVLGHLAHSALFLTVSARDGGGLPSATNAAVTVNILQTVLAPAIFERSRYTFSVPEGAPEDSLIGTVKAREPPNSLEVVSYRISSGDPHGKFSIDPQFGIIRTKKQLDHETQSAVVLTIQSQLGNSPVYSSTQVNVSVIDINDNPPVFLTKSDKVTISHTQPPGTAVYIAHAEDKDSGLNGAIKYSIASKQSNAFSIDPSLGVVNLTRTVFADKQQEYTLHIAAEDCGSPPLTSLLMLTVVIEEQKMGPTLVFQNLVYQVEVSEATSPGARILQVQAHLLDPHSVSSNLTYFLEPSTDSVAFGINSDTGWIYLRKHLNYECAQILSFRALVSTSEDENLRQNASTSVIVNVLDENDNSPMFMHESYFFEIEENPIPRGVVGTITAVDRDSGRNGQLSYFLLSDGKYFKMNSNTGEIINWVSLDREKQAHHQLSVLVTDQGSPRRSATAAVYIAVRDRNDHAPRFPRPALRLQVLEGQPSGTLVTTIFAKDFDSGNNGVVLYSIESEEDIGYFQIDAVSGELRTTRSLSHAERSDYRMMITARDQGMPSLQGHATVYIQDVEVGFLVHHIIAKDPDEGRNGQVTYHILSGNENKAFVLDKITGLLTTAQLLDREIQERYSLTVMALDDGSPALSATQVLTIIVLDVNDEIPIFTKQLYETAVHENQDPGEFVIKVEAVDRDAGLNSLLWYKILPGIGYEKFKMNLSSGELVTTASLDRETQEVFSIKVLVQDSGTPSLSSTVTVICTVLDENDHSPMFLFPASEIWIPENQQPSVVYISQAVDMDAGNNGALRYKIIGGNVGGYFTLNHTSGKLLVTRGLDREDISNFTLVIECHDLGSPSRSSTAQLYLTVLDENDHSPLFAKTQYQISVTEDLEEGSAILDLYASDEDDGLNGEVMYSLIDDTFGAFAIDSVTGSIVTTKALDRETKSHYTFRVVASDCSTHLPRSTTVSVVVHIEDVNDNDPIFLQNPIRAFVPAETPVNEIVATVRAEDVDLGSNGAIVFNLMIAETVFQIDVKTGDIILQEPLASKDFRTQLLVTASDQGISPRTATAMVIIFTEEQEEEISFSHSLYEASVPENSAAGTSLLTVEAYEHKFMGEDIKYSIFSDKESIFSIHPTTGTITVKEPKFLDYEVKCKIHLTVLAENSLNSALCGVTVLIQDVNDNVPKFEQSYYKASVWEGQSPKMDIVQVFATDLDSGLNGEMEYSILSGNENATFLIDSARGILATNTGLDHENTSSYRLVVQAADKGNPRLSATSIVRIEVLDVNDNAPVFQLLGEVEVPENAQPGFIVTQVSASDADSRPALQFGFIYDNGPGMKFAINQHTGVVTVVEPLDFEETAVYKLKIIVSDSVHQTEAELTILVLDINDNPPVFTQDSYQVNLPELISMDATVLTVSATDRDSGHNGMISYKILSSSEGFSIDHKNGSVFATGPVTQLKNISTIHLLIETMDGGSPTLTAVTSIEVHIEDVNNCAPQFTKVLYNLSVSEDASVGESVLMFSAIDYDWTHENTYVEYSIIEGNAENLFSIETSVMGSETSYKLVGSLVLSNVLDRETASSHHLVLLASDCGTPSLNSTATVLITVLDVNDNAPVFSSPEYHVHVKESIPIGSHVTEVSANDCDAGTNAEITYAIISGDDRGHFRLDEKTGSMDLMKTLDYEDTMKFTLIIQATDGGADIKNMAFAVVFVNVLDDNDYAPSFLFPSLSCTVSENMPTFSFVCTVCALDFDKGSYGHITYSIQSSCLAHREAPRDHDMFFIDPLTGDIHTKQMFDYESQNRYCLIIQAKDKGDSLATITVQVDIEGRDEFDPVFTQEHYFFNLPEKNEAGQLLGRVTASDGDGGLDGVVHYSLLKPSPFFSVNQTSGNIYLTQTVHRKKNGIKKNDDSLELLVRAHSPKMESKFTICTVFVNVSSSPDIDLTASAHSLTISVSISSIVFLLLVVGLIALTLRHKRKDLMNACVKKEAVSSSATDVNSAREDKDCQKIQSTESSMLPMGAIAKWLSLARIGEGKDDDVPCRHSDSSGHGSAEGETAEDEEIKRINEYPCRKNTSSALSEYGSRMPDSGIPRESDQFSYQSGEMDGMATMQSTENMQTIKGESREEACDTAYAHEILSQTLKKIGIKEKGIMTDLTRECVPMSDRQDSGCDSLATVGTSDEDLAGSYNRDYVLSWEPRFQSLASVFNDIAELKDENVHIHSLPKEKKSLVFPPPLITSVAQPGIRTVPPRMPNITSRQAFNKYAHSPIIHNLGYPPPTMTPSFSPSLSLLTMQTPTASPVVSDGKMIGTCLIDPSYELAMEEEIQV
ncbi:protocadherin-23 isoform X2 [Pipra filicauda]|uniref:Protocadherin-23 isoform X2 n=1 Tax=Pipra filicauda TaxID=649802 RepID=A0A7R5KU87_9PASS|nr:protocadherin-23 isoform X2 [Pipra filicauda]